jgi:hypothetical protein
LYERSCLCPKRFLVHYVKGRPISGGKVTQATACDNQLTAFVDNAAWRKQTYKGLRGVEFAESHRLFLIGQDPD